MRRPAFRTILLALTLWASTTGTAAQYPAKPITIIVPFAAGGSNDILARAIGRKLTEAWGQPVIIDNRGGGGGLIGIAAVAKAAPDGYTILLVSSSFTINPAVRTKLPFDPVSDFIPVAYVGSAPFVVAAARRLPVNTMAELIALARAKPGTINYGSAGAGGANHMAGEMLKAAAGIQLTHVPYRGGSLVMNDLIAGHVDLYVSSLPQILELVRTGQVKALALTSRRRSPVIPELPTVAESGVPGFETAIWWGILAPAGTPHEVVVSLNAQINKALASEEIGEVMRREGGEPGQLSPDGFSAFIRAEIERWQKVAKDADIRVD